MVARSDAAQMGEGRHQADGAMAAHAQVTDVVEKNDAGDAGRVFGLNQQRADHHVRTARLVYDGRTKRIVLLSEYVQFISHAAAVKLGSAAHHDARGFAAGVRVNDRNAFHDAAMGDR